MELTRRPSDQWPLAAIASTSMPWTANNRRPSVAGTPAVILAEKPMCLSPREAESIIRAESRSDATVMVGYMRRFAPAFTEAVELVPQLGQIHYARVHDVIGRNHLIVEQTSDVVRPDDISQADLELRRERGRRLVADAIGDVSPAVSRAYRLLCGYAPLTPGSGYRPARCLPSVARCGTAEGCDEILDCGPSGRVMTPQTGWGRCHRRRSRFASC